MKNTFLPLSLSAYLSCAAPPKQIPIVEVPHCSGTMEDKGTKRVDRPPKESPQEKAAFIAKTLEEALGKYPKASVVHGDIYFRESYGNSHYQISYIFNSEAFCSLDNNKIPLFKKNLIITLREIKGSFSTKDYRVTSINLGSQGSPFYPMNTVSITNSGDHLPLERTYYTPFPEAKKLYRTLLQYVAHELQSIEKVYDHQNSIEVPQTYKTISSEEENIIKSYKLILEKIKQAQPLSGNKIFVQPCKP